MLSSRRSVVLGVAELALGLDDALLAHRHVGLALHQLERRHGTDFDLDAVALVQLAREVEALLRDVELLARLDQVPVGIDHLLDGRGDLGFENLAADLAAPARHQEQPVGIGVAEAAQQGLVELEGHVRAVGGAQRVDVGLAPGVLPAERQIAAGRQELADPEVQVLHAVLRGHELGDLRAGLVLGESRGFGPEVVEAEVLLHGQPRRGAVVALDGDREVLAQRDLDRLFQSEQDGAVHDVDRRRLHPPGIGVHLQGRGRRGGRGILGGGARQRTEPDHAGRQGRAQGPGVVPETESQGHSPHEVLTSNW